MSFQVPGLPSEQHRVELEVNVEPLEPFAEDSLNPDRLLDLLPVLPGGQHLIRPPIAQVGVVEGVLQLDTLSEGIVRVSAFDFLAVLPIN